MDRDPIMRRFEKTGEFPVQIRDDLIITIVDLPYDLTVAEAKKLCGVIMAHATDAREALSTEDGKAAVNNANNGENQ